MFLSLPKTEAAEFATGRWKLPFPSFSLSMVVLQGEFA
jgi:hypothetical protein